MVVLIFIHDKSDLRLATAAAQFKRGRCNRRIVCNDTSDHVRARLGIYVIKTGIAADASRLVEGQITVCILHTLLNLLRILDVESIHEAVVCFADDIIDPTQRLILGLCTAEGSLARADLGVLSAEGLSWKRRRGAGSETLAASLRPPHPSRFWEEVLVIA